MTIRQLWCALRGHAGVAVDYNNGVCRLTCKRCRRSWVEGWWR